VTFFIADAGWLGQSQRERAFDGLRRHLADQLLGFEFEGIVSFYEVVKPALAIHGDREVSASFLNEEAVALISSAAGDGDRDKCRDYLLSLEFEYDPESVLPTAVYDPPLWEGGSGVGIGAERRASHEREQSGTADYRPLQSKGPAHHVSAHLFTCNPLAPGKSR
jgi:hypothetical protein